MQDINSKNTAIKRGGPSRPLLDLYEQQIYLHPDFHSVLDYGCGRGEDVRWLREKGFKHKIVGWDPNYISNPLPGHDEKFDIVLCIYVVNVLPTVEEREQVILEAWDRVEAGGCLYLVARSEKELTQARKRKRWQQHNDGWITSKARKTFQKGFTNQELKALTAKLGSIHYIEEWHDDINYSQIRVIKK